MQQTITNDETNLLEELRPKLKSLAVSDSGFVFDPHKGQSFTVNDTGLAILRELQNGSSIEVTASIIGETFHCTYSKILQEIQQYLTQLNRSLA